MKPSWLLPFSLLFFASSAWGAACCGGGFAAPSIIAGDDKAQFAASLSHTNVVIDNVDSKGFWRKWDEQQQVKTIRLEGAHLISDRWQAGATLPLLQRSRMGQEHSGLGDISGTLGYEYLPDWDYHLFRPKGIGFLQITVPTGKSKFDSDVGGLDSRGNGLWAIGAGTLLTKAVGRWDAFASFEIHQSMRKSVSNSQINGWIEPGVGGSFGLGAGYNRASWRYGASVTWIHEDPIDVRGDMIIDGSIERYATAAASLSYVANDDWLFTLSFADQTLVGHPTNTSLGKTVAFLLQRRWGR